MKRTNKPEPQAALAALVDLHGAGLGNDWGNVDVVTFIANNAVDLLPILLDITAKKAKR